MPFCPECRDEFEDWVKTCPDCKVPLVDKLPPKPPKPPRQPRFNNEPMVHIATAPNEAVAFLWAGILEENGVRCVLKSDNLRSAMYVFLINHFYTIHVLKSSVLRAKRILRPLAKTNAEYIESRGNCFSLKSTIFIVIIYLFWLFGR
jgi:hypothetical protein